MKYSYDNILSGLTFGVKSAGNHLARFQLSRRSLGHWEGDQFKADADICSHQLLTNYFSEFFPNLPIHSEESDFTPPTSSDYLLIDPIDGTRSFSEGFPGWVVQASYIYNNRPVVSAIYAPESDHFFHAVQSKGAFYNGAKIVRNYPSVLTSITDNYPEPSGISRYLYNSLNLTRYVESGSLSLKLCLVASGEVDLFVKDMSPRDWDIGPPMLLLSELDVFFSDLNRRPFLLNHPPYSHSGLVACLSHSSVDIVFDHISRYN